ncbi:MAG: hypothetical protein WDO74_36455 [Pseudomonadota bacterium]
MRSQPQSAAQHEHHCPTAKQRRSYRARPSREIGHAPVVRLPREERIEVGAGLSLPGSNFAKEVPDESGGKLYAGSPDGIYRLDGDTFTRVAGTETSVGAALGINSAGTSFFLRADGLVACPLSGTNAGQAKLRLAATGLYDLNVFANDRIFAQPSYLSGPTTAWLP